MDISEIQAAFDDVFDQALVFHGFADYVRDYEVFVCVTFFLDLVVNPVDIGHAPFIV